MIQARNYTPANRTSLRLIVMHTMESPEKPGTARAVASWFAGPSAPRASAHVCVDATEVVQCVRAEDVAWAAPGANRDGYHVELAGRASQDRAAWDDEPSRAELKLAAEHCADVADRWGVPLVRLTPEDVAAGKRGFCGHVDCTVAFKTKGGHTDPGASFPWEAFMQLVEEATFALKLAQVVAQEPERL